MQCVQLVRVLYLKQAMAGTLVPSDSTQAMASLMSAYVDEEADEDAVHDTSGVSAPPENEAELSPDTRTQQAAANFISDDEDAHHSPPEDTDDKRDTKSPVVEHRPMERTSEWVLSHTHVES